MRAGNRDVHIPTAHLKSKLLTFPGGFAPRTKTSERGSGRMRCNRRASEATTLRIYPDVLLNGGGREKAVILTGDMNDELDAATTQILNGPTGSEIGTTGFGRAPTRVTATGCGTSLR